MDKLQATRLDRMMTSTHLETLQLDINNSSPPLLLR